MYLRQLLLLVCAVPLTLQAGTVVEMTGPDGQTATTRIEGSRSRVDTAEPGVYMLMDADAGTVYMVNTNERRVMDMSAMLAARGAAGGNAPAVRLERQGPGPEIAGYGTVHYRRMVGATHCGDEYLAQAPMADANLRHFGEAISRMGGMRNRMSGMTGITDPCSGDDSALFDTYLEAGMPMRSVNQHGQITNQVRSIRANVDIPARDLEKPADYAVMDMQQMMRNAMQGLPDSGAGDINMDDLQRMREEAQRRMQQMQKEMERRGNN